MCVFGLWTSCLRAKIQYYNTWPFAKKLYHGWISTMTSSNEISWKLPPPRNEELVASLGECMLFNSYTRKIGFERDSAFRATNLTARHWYICASMYVSTTDAPYTHPWPVSPNNLQCLGRHPQLIARAWPNETWLSNAKVHIRQWIFFRD